MAHCSSVPNDTESPQCSILADSGEAMEHCFLFPDNSQHRWLIILMAPIRACAVGNVRVIGVGGKHYLHVRLWVVMVSASTFLDVYLGLSELSVNASCCYCPHARLTPLGPRSPILSVKGFLFHLHLQMIDKTTSDVSLTSATEMAPGNTGL